MTVLVLLLGIPIVEIVVAAWVAGQIGVGWMLLALLGLTLLGLFLLPRVGLHGIRRVQQATERGERPGRELVDGGLLMVAALLLILPGFVTGLVGLLLLVPPLRHVVGRSWSKRFDAQVQVVHATARGSVIDASSSESATAPGATGTTGPAGGARTPPPSQTVPAAPRELERP